MFNQFMKCYVSVHGEHQCCGGNKDERRSLPAPKDATVELEGKDMYSHSYNAVFLMREEQSTMKPRGK